MKVSGSGFTSHCSLTYLSYHVAGRTLTCQVCRSVVLGTLWVHVPMPV